MGGAGRKEAPEDVACSCSSLWGFRSPECFPPLCPPSSSPTQNTQTPEQWERGKAAASE